MHIGTHLDNMVKEPPFTEKYYEVFWRIAIFVNVQRKRLHLLFVETT